MSLKENNTNSETERPLVTDQGQPNGTFNVLPRTLF